MKFISSIIVVEDVIRSRRLYEGLLGQKVTAEFGDNNISFEGGLSFYKKSLYQQLIGERVIVSGTNNFELYFEADGLPQIEQAVREGGFEFIHSLREEPWKQLVFRFYDCDRNVVVIAERMESVSYRLFNENMPLDEIARVTGYSAEQVRQFINAYQE